MLASSSPPKVSRVRQGPRSSTTTRRPRSVSTFAAVAPEAPAPMMQTSARSGFALGATVVLLSGVPLGKGRRPRDPDQSPADPVAVPAVDRVGVEALPGVQGQQRQEVQLHLDAGLLQRGLHRRETRLSLRLRQLRLLLPGGRRKLRQDLVLLLVTEAGEVGAEAGLAAPVQLPDALDVLAAHDVEALLPGLGPLALELLEAAAVRLGVDVVQAGEVPVEEV